MAAKFSATYKKVNWKLGIIRSRETLLPVSVITTLQIHDTPAFWIVCASSQTDYNRIMARRIKEYEESSTFNGWGIQLYKMSDVEKVSGLNCSVSIPIQKWWTTQVSRWQTRKIGDFFFSSDTQLSCRTCQQDAVDAENSHQREIVRFCGK